MVYGIIIAALAAGSFFACQMEEFAGVRAPARQKDNGPPVPKTPYLDTLSLDNGLTLAPIFTPNVISYTVNLPNPPPETVTITATAAAGLGIDYPTGQTVAPSPESPAQIVVTNEVGMSTAYLLVFDPGDLPSARLLDIKLSQGQIADFDPDEFVYSVELPYETGEVAIVPIPEIAGSLFNYNPASTIDMTDGEARSVTIGVVAPNHSLGEYRIDFTVGAAQASRLANVSLSAGSLDQPFAAEILAYTINIYEGIHPLVVDAIRISTADTVRFLETSTSTVLAESPAKAFTEADLNGLQFTITVHQGIGYTPTDYTFTISTSPMLPAKLSSIVFANGGAPVGTLYRGLPGEQAGTAFDSDITAYTLEFTHEAIATMTVSGQGGAKALISPNIIGNTITVDYNPLQASMLLAGSSTPVRKFVTITAHEDAHIDTTYTVYFKKTPLPRATLDKLEVFGGTLVHTVDGPAVTDADVQNAASFDAQNKKQYTVTAMANTQAVIVEGTPKAATNIGVTYQPKNFLSGLTVGADSIISVDVSDGDLDYAATTYELTVHVLEAQNPRLIAPLTVNSESITLDDSRLVYAHTIPYAGYANGGSPFVAWSPNGCVTEVTYSFNLGAQWFDDTEKDGFTAAEAAAKQFVVNYSETKHILVKLRAVDGTEAVYTLIITQEGNPSANLTDIKVYDVETGGIAITIKQRIDQTPGFLPTVYAYDVRIGADTAFIEPLGPPPGASITYSIVGGSSGSYTPGGARIPVSNLSIDTAQVVEISVHPQGGGRRIPIRSTYNNRQTTRLCSST